jgi:hypothetical protein
MAYRIERVKDGSLASDSRQRIVRHFRLKMAAFYFGMLALLCGLVGVFSGVAYLLDDSDKNVPVAAKYMLSSAVYGYPPANATELWRAQFRQPDVAVWPYYTLLGAVCASVVVLVAFACIGSSFDDRSRPHRSCADQCDGCCGRNSSNTPTCWGCYQCYCPCDTYYDPYPYGFHHHHHHGGLHLHHHHHNAVDCTCCCSGCGDCDHHHCNCNDCKHSGGGGGGDLGQLLIALVLIVIVVVLVSAIAVIMLQTVRKWALFHDRMTDMLRNQASELESETIVLGIDEALRPTDAV